MKEFSYTIEDVTEIDAYGGIHMLSIYSDEVLKSGYEHADLIEVSFLGKTLVMPLVPDFNFIDILSQGVTTYNFGADYLVLLCNGGIFAEMHGIVKRSKTEGVYWDEGDGIKFPITFTIRLKEKQGYAKEYAMLNIRRENRRSAYPTLTDEEYGNFREVSLGNIKPGILYRSSSPIDPMIGRAQYVDDAIERHNIKTIANLHDNEGMAKRHEPYEKSAYKSKNVIYVHQPVGFFNERFESGVKSMVEYFLNNEGPYLIHCLEGKDRTGYIVAMIECLMGASIQEIKEDYAKTYTNMFFVRKGTESYAAFSNRIVKCLEGGFEKKTLEGLNLKEEANKYLLKIGLSQEQINRFENLLSK